MPSRWLPIIGILLSPIFTVSAAPAALERWRLLYFYDELSSSLVINDFKFLTPTHGVATGFLVDKRVP